MNSLLQVMEKGTKHAVTTSTLFSPCSGFVCFVCWPLLTEEWKCMFSAQETAEEQHDAVIWYPHCSSFTMI